jgi:hypothetical protein
MLQHKSTNSIPYFLLAIIGVLLIYTSVRNYYDDKLLEGETKKTIAIITDINSGTGVRQIANIDFYYYAKKVKYVTNDNVDFNFGKLGDTVLIEYAIADHSVARVVDKYYMKKYAYLKKIEQ